MDGRYRKPQLARLDDLDDSGLLCVRRFGGCCRSLYALHRCRDRTTKYAISSPQIGIRSNAPLVMGNKKQLQYRES